MAQVFEKLAYIEHFKRANHAVDYMLQLQKEPRRWSLDNVERERMEHIMEDVKVELKKMQRHYQDTMQQRIEAQAELAKTLVNSQTTLDDAIQYYLQRCVQEKCAALLIPKKIVDKKLVISREHMNTAQCKALSQSLDVSFKSFKRVEIHAAPY